VLQVFALFGLTRIALAYELGSIVASPTHELRFALFADTSAEHVLVLPYLALTMRRRYTRWSYRPLTLLSARARNSSFSSHFRDRVIPLSTHGSLASPEGEPWTLHPARRSAERINGAVESRADAITFAGSCEAMRRWFVVARKRIPSQGWARGIGIAYCAGLCIRCTQIRISVHALCESARYIRRTYVDFLGEDKFCILSGGRDARIWGFFGMLVIKMQS